MATSVWGDSGRFLDELDEDGGLDQQQDEWRSGRDGVIFLIDYTEPMFTLSSNDHDDDSCKESPFEICIKCARNTLMSKIISSDKDLVAIVFFGTEKFSNTNNFKHVYIYQDLDMPDADRIKNLETLMKDISEGNPAEIYGHSKSFSMADALWACSNIFANCTYNMASKRVMIFTNTDDPHENNPELKRRALRKAKDLEDLGIFIDLMHMKQRGKTFDISKFYKDIVFFDEDEDPNILVDPSYKFEELLARVQCKEYKKRALASIPLRLSDGLELGVSVYTLCRPAVRSSYVKVDARSNEEVKTVTKYICEDTKQELMPTDIKYSQDFGGTKIKFEKNEVQTIGSLVDTGLHLLGFKPKSSIKPYYYVKPGQFVYPNDNAVSGSKSLFSALLKRCLARDVVPICMYMQRTGGTPRLAALMPQKEQLDEHGLQLKPAGFCLTFLPYSDDIRKLKLAETEKATNIMIDKAKEIVEKLKFKFSSENFENPSLQLFYRTLEALALDRDEVEPVKNATLPMTDEMEAKAGKLMAEFNNLVFPDGYREIAKTAAKRKDASSGTAAKRTRVEPGELDMRKEAANGTLNQLTVPILKEFCRMNKLKPASTKKAHLIDVIQGYFEVL
eukprot:gene5227-5884_t